MRAWRSNPRTCNKIPGCLASPALISGGGMRQEELQLALHPRLLVTGTVRMDPKNRSMQLPQVDMTTAERAHFFSSAFRTRSSDMLQLHGQGAVRANTRGRAPACALQSTPYSYALITPITSTTTTTALPQPRDNGLHHRPPVPPHQRRLPQPRTRLVPQRQHKRHRRPPRAPKPQQAPR